MKFRVLREKATAFFGLCALSISVSAAEGVPAKRTTPDREKIDVGKAVEIVYPEGETVEWYGYKRHNFVLDGHKGFIVEPRNPAPGLPWCWCLQWPEAFVPRTPALKLLERGFHHVHLDVFESKLNPDGVKTLEKFYALLQTMHFHKKAALIGMSYGGLFSLRWAAEHPETVGAIYLDAPVCDLGFCCNRDLSNSTRENLSGWEKSAGTLAAAYATTPEKLSGHKLSPLNNVQPIADAKIPVLAVRNGQDRTVPPETNLDVWVERFRAAGGFVTVIRRDFYGHHPHGMDDPQMLVDFILRHYPAF
ncbi:MAG: alpha/beta hydrolase [Victivallaceae bacterium]|nr:alpha/beta hydrolase [Victivallaceae bacterium]